MNGPIPGGEGSRTPANATPPASPIRVHTLHQAGARGLL